MSVRRQSSCSPLTQSRVAGDLRHRGHGQGWSMPSHRAQAARVAMSVPRPEETAATPNRSTLSGSGACSASAGRTSAASAKMALR